MLVVAYTAGAYTRGPAIAVGALCALAIPVVISLTDRDGFSVGGVIFFATFALPPYLAGLAIARRRRRETALEQHAATLDADRERAAAAAVIEERARIARELHDVVAHAVSTMVVQAQAAPMVRVEPTRGASERIRARSSAAGATRSTEMRRLLGMLRAATSARRSRRSPGRRTRRRSSTSVRGAGLPVDLRDRGRRRALPPASTCPPTGSCRRR